MPSLELPEFHWKQLPNEGQLMSLYRGVIVCWDEDIDTRVLEFVDNMPTHLRERLIAIGENQASVSFLWKGVFWRSKVREEQLENCSPGDDQWTVGGWAMTSCENCETPLTEAELNNAPLTHLCKVCYYEEKSENRNIEATKPKPYDPTQEKVIAELMATSELDLKAQLAKWEEDATCSVRMLLSHNYVGLLIPLLKREQTRLKHELGVIGEDGPECWQEELCGELGHVERLLKSLESIESKSQ